ncbi:MAG TPA: response regulator transcription factor [Thermoanaerobaculia bacterium]|nr:response regulator transcription factor [Thermoanaerobaculia bacterium]
MIPVRILIVEDERSLREGLVALLTKHDFAVDAVGDGLTGAERGAQSDVDFVLLDLTLPRLDGVEVCRRLRMARSALPILILTARGSEEERVKGLNAGADDYLTKPFGTHELLARIEALRRRASVAPADAERVEIDGCLLDLGRCEARRNGSAVALTPREVGILRWLHRHRARAVSRAELLQTVWGAPAEATEELETRTVDMTIANLRQKIEREPADPHIVVTVKGVGYAWGRT